MSEASRRYERAIQEFFAAHAEDPRQIERNGEIFPDAVVYHERMREWLEKLAPDASEPLRLAAQAQHLRRWKIPRSDYPEGRLGYKKWRSDLADFHGNEAGAILRNCGFGSETIERVQALLRKDNFANDPEGQLLQDVVCLVFLEHDFEEFAAKQEDEKMISILRKTWRKMSARGQEVAAELAQKLPANLRDLVQRAVSE